MDERKLMETPQQIVNASAMRYWKQIEDKRVRDAQKIYFWYYNYQDEIVKYVKDAMRKGWRDKTIEETRVRVLNVVPRVIDKLALLYKESPERMLDGGELVEIDDATGEESDEQSADDVAYQTMLKSSTIETKQGEWEKLSKAFNTVLVQPVWKEVDGKGYIDYTIHTPAWCCVETLENDYTQPESFWYPIWRTVDGSLQPEQVLVYWDEDEHYLIDSNGKRINGENNANGKNPYGVLPVAVLRRKLSNDFWGEGMWDLVDGDEEICIQVTNLFKVAAYQLHGQPFGVNLNLAGEPMLGADKPILVDGVEQGTVQPSFEFVTASPQLKPVMDLVDWALKNIQIAKGLGVNQVDIQQTVASGASKMVDNAGMQEERTDAIKLFQSFEADLFRVTMAVYNYHTSEKKIDPDAEFTIKFPEPKITETTDEKNKKREAGLKNGTMSRIDIIMEDFGCTRAEAKLKLRQIIAENKEFDDEFGLNTNAMDEVDGSEFEPKSPEEIAMMSPDERAQYEKDLANSKTNNQRNTKQMQQPPRPQ
jgi:hypothetical protein